MIDIKEIGKRTGIPYPKIAHVKTIFKIPA